MERKRNRLIFILIAFFSLNLSASYRSEIYTAYITNKMTEWKQVVDRMNDTQPKTNDFLLELVNYQYGYIAWCIGNNKNEEAKKYLDLAEINLEILSGVSKNMSIVYSYRSAFYGYRIGLNLVMAPFLGMKSIDCAKTAISLDKENPLGYVAYANIQFYMPAVFGGSKKEAVDYYIKALQLLESNEKDLSGDWNYVNLLTVIAQSYSSLNDLQSSKIYCEKILKIEPEFSWIKNELYPQVLNRMKK